jgi:hypothetical protein
MTFRKWYFAVNKVAITDSFDQLFVCVASAKAHTSLIPICLIEDTFYEPHLQDRIDSLDVTVIKHTAEIFGEVEKVHGKEKSAPFNGHWLRTDIPIIEREDEFVLYTDFDVMFRSDVTTSDFRPTFLAVGPEHWMPDWSYFNSGVMVMNLPNLRGSRKDFFNVVKKNIANTPPHDDQTMYNICYRDRYDRLPLSWNWKPYWGFSDLAEIVHFHGPKPGHVMRMLDGFTYDEMLIFHEMLARNPEGYAAYMAEYDSYLEKPT